MQDNLTLLFDLILAAGGGYLSLSFVLGLVGLWRRCDPGQQPPATLKAERVAVKAESSRKADAVVAETPAIEAEAETIEAEAETKVPLEPIPLGELKRPEAEPKRLEPEPELLEAADEMSEASSAALIEPAADNP